MSIMDLFRSPAPQTQQQPPQQTQNGQQLQAAQPSLQPTQIPGDAGGQTVEPKEPVDPMAAFSKLWEKPEKVEGAEEEFNPSAIFNLDPASVQKAVGQINFADGITEDQLAAVSAGGPDAVKALATILNQSSSKAMSLSTTAAAKMIEQAMTKASGAMNSRIDKQTKLNQVSSQLQEFNPALSNPAAAPILEGLKQQLVNKYPTASAKEISDMAVKYLGSFADIAAGKKEAPAPETTTSGTDWEKYMSL